MRKFFDRYGAYVAVGILILAGVFFYLFNRPAHVKIPVKAFFVDERTGVESLLALTDVPPLQGSDGKDSIVREMKYSCDDLRTSKVAYYYKFTPAVKAKLEAINASGKPSDYDPSSGEWVRSPEGGSAWVPVNSEEGQKLTTIRCPGGHPVSIVFPG